METFGNTSILLPKLRGLSLSGLLGLKDMLPKTTLIKESLLIHTKLVTMRLTSLLISALPCMGKKSLH